MALAPTTNANDLVLTGTLSNAGSISQTSSGAGSPAVREAATLNNSGTYNIASDGSGLLYAYNGTDAFNNTGTFEKTAEAGTTSVASLAFDNASGGIVTVTTGTLALGNGTLSGGTFKRQWQCGAQPDGWQRSDVYGHVYGLRRGDRAARERGR